MYESKNAGKAPTSADICAEKAPERGGATSAFIVSTRDLCWLSFLACLLGFLIGRWIP